MLARLLDRVLADSEADTESDGYLSWRAEWHAAAWGFASLFLATLFWRPEFAAAVVGWLLSGQISRRELNVPYPQQIAKEAAYALGHGAAGVVIAIGLRTVVL